MEKLSPQSGASLKLAEIQRRCEELMEEQAIELTFADPEHNPNEANDPFNPYGSGA